MDQFNIAFNATDEEIKQVLKGFGFSYFQDCITSGLVDSSESDISGNRWAQYSSIIGTNTKRGLKINVKSREFKETDKTPAYQSVRSVSFERRIDVGRDKTRYCRFCEFEKTKDDTWLFTLKHQEKCGLANEAYLSWFDMLQRVDNIIQTISGHATIPKQKSDGILQNLIMADLKKKLHKAGYPKVVFASKAITSDEASELALRANSMFYNITLKLRSGELTIELTNGMRKRVPIPCFEDPSFDPEKLFPAAIMAIREMRDLQTKHDLAQSNAFAAFKNMKWET
jgi:hypothetical protein